jgi:hypothetical protein
VATKSNARGQRPEGEHREPSVRCTAGLCARVCEQAVCCRPLLTGDGQFKSQHHASDQRPMRTRLRNGSRRARTSSGASSGRKCPHVTPPPVTSSAHCLQISRKPVGLPTASASPESARTGQEILRSVRRSCRSCSRNDIKAAQRRGAGRVVQRQAIGHPGATVMTDDGKPRGAQRLHNFSRSRAMARLE